MKEECLVFLVLSASFSVLVECRAVSRECHDKFQNCQTWRRSGYCEANSHVYYLRNVCAKTCGFCRSNTPVISDLHPVQDAPQEVQKSNQKANLAADTASHKENQAANVNTLHRIHDLPQVATLHYKALDESGQPDCTDRFVSQTCQGWKDGEICMDDRYRKYLTYGCAMTCRFCNCIDTYRESPYCEEWKSRGFCETYKDQLDTYCPKTCGFCINAKYEETPEPSQNATAPNEPSQNATTPTEPSQNATAPTEPSQNATAPTSPSHNTTNPTEPSQNATKSPGLDQEGESPGVEVKVVKSAINNHPTEFVETGNANIKRGFPEGTSPLWSVTGDRKLTLPQPQQYDDMGGAVRRPLEDGTYFTPAKTSDKFDYYTEHYSPDPYVAAAQREEWMTVNAGDGVAPSPSLSRKSKAEKETIQVLKKSKIRHAKHGRQKTN